MSMPSMSARGLGPDRSAVASASTYMGPHTHAAYTGPRAPSGPRYDLQRVHSYSHFQ